MKGYQNRLAHLNSYFDEREGFDGYVIVGDFNKENTSREVGYMCAGMAVIDTDPTHISGSTIDLVILVLKT